VLIDEKLVCPSCMMESGEENPVPPLPIDRVFRTR